MAEINKVKNDLRDLKSHAHMIKRLSEAHDMHIKRIQFLQRLGNSDEILENIETEKRLIDKLDAGKYIREAQILEEKYMSAINDLSPLDKTIILDGYVNGNPYWKVGMELGYTEDGVRKRVNKIIEDISKRV